MPRVKRLTPAQKDALTYLADNPGWSQLSNVGTRTRGVLVDRGYIQFKYGHQYGYRLTARGHMALFDGPEEADAASFVYDVEGEYR